jgi:hypothetical protein
LEPRRALFKTLYLGLGLREVPNSNEVTKEQFDDLMQNSDFDSDSRVVFMQEIMKRFSIEVAKANNISFAYFASKLLPS